MTRTSLIAMASAAALAASTGATGAMQTATSVPASRPDQATPPQTGQSTMPMTSTPGQTRSTMPMTSTPGQTGSSTMPTTTPGQTTSQMAPNAADTAVARGTLVDVAAAEPNLTTFVSAVRAAGLDTTLASGGPFTVFAPTNDAFGRLAPGAVDTLMKPENKPALTKVLNYHVVSGRYTNDQLKQMVKQGGGTATLTTVEGEPLKLSVVNGNIALQGVNGNKSYLTTPGSAQPTGIVHIVNGVLVPNLGAGASSGSTTDTGASGS